MTQGDEHQACPGGDIAVLRHHLSAAHQGLILGDHLRRQVQRTAESAPAERGAAAVDSPGAVTAEDRLGQIDALDLEPIVYKLMHPEPGICGLSLVEADQHVALYRCFWKLCVLEPAATLVPTRQLDHVWHTHMLDTAKYRADCDWVFGFFLDHFPYFGFRGAEDRLSWLEDFARTRRLFRDHFGAEISTQPAASACSTHGDVSECCFGCVKSPASLGRPRPDRSVPIARKSPASGTRNGAQP